MHVARIMDLNGLWALSLYISLSLFFLLVLILSHTMLLLLLLLLLFLLCSIRTSSHKQPGRTQWIDIKIQRIIPALLAALFITSLLGYWESCLATKRKFCRNTANEGRQYYITISIYLNQRRFTFSSDWRAFTFLLTLVSRNQLRVKLIIDWSHL